MGRTIVFLAFALSLTRPTVCAQIATTPTDGHPGFDQVEITIGQALTELAERLRTEAPPIRGGEATQATSEAEISVSLIYEGWRDQGSAVRVRGSNAGVLSYRWEPNPTQRRLSTAEWASTDGSMADALDSLQELLPGVTWSVHPETGTVCVSENVLIDNPDWPLNHQLDDFANTPMSLGEAIELLQRQYHLQNIGSPEIREAPDMSIAVWNPNEHDENATVRDLPCAIQAATGPSDQWQGAFLISSGFDPALPQDSLRELSEVWCFYEPGR